MPTSSRAVEAGSVDPTRDPGGVDEFDPPNASRARAGSRRKKKGRGRTVLHVLGSVVLVMALVTGLSVVYLYRHLSGNIQGTDIAGGLDNRPDVVKVEGKKQPLNVLIMGSDARFDDEAMGQRSDTTILLHLSANRKRAYGVSIPRDLIIDRPECGKNAAVDQVMFNTGFQVGGAQCTLATFEAMSGIRAEHQIVVDFPGFRDMVDAIGGVRMCIPEEINDPTYLKTTIPAGKNVKLKGQQALDYVRVRHGVGDGSDISRTKRQQAFIAAMASQVLSADVMTNPIKLVSFLNSATKSLHVDPGLANAKDLASLALEFKNIGLDDIQFITIPNAYYPRDSPFWGRVYPTEDAPAVWKAIRNDKRIPNYLLNGVVKATGTAGPDASASAAPSGSASPGASASASPSTSPSASGSSSPSSSPSTRAPVVSQYDDPSRNGLCG